ncbi:cobalt-precorrin-6A reductase [Nocardia puris]|uniref:cobalt-precorrin-6A reductase n=1 Tax=Nocardia puris TaxID=208602 RepID=UPI00189638F9|nr:cobalt-precorrin-6A reductase [Nocardia puris]MBF6209966.1 cobalt-precorrin-6A reductase [Nocardia puris]MBF6368158.1 cobalt-precorrin-6A reductase [Nocardia puris]MBF6458123.1 cobalt-precorrin-6A reductase [Nocardia puris]
MKALILGGTGEARRLAHLATGERGLEIVTSLAGRVRNPAWPEGEVRVGGFGGAEGMREWLADNDIDAVVVATHPFAARISANASTVARAAGVPLLHLRRPGWTESPGDRWIRVPDLDEAARVLPSLGARVFLTIGRQGVGAFAGVDGPWFLIRSIDPPSGPLPARHELLFARGPFTSEEEAQLLAAHRIDVLVTKDSGGEQTEAKLVAARAAGIPVVVVERPPLPGGEVVDNVEDAWEWLRDKVSRAASAAEQRR